MKMTHVLLLTGFAAALAAGSPMLAEERAAASFAAQERAPAPSGGALAVLPHGTYQCALPGDVASKPYTVVASEEFRIGAASKYRNAQGTGAYLLRGDELIFTRGPKKGERYKRVGTNQLRKMDNGKTTKLLCTRLGTAG